MEIAVVLTFLPINILFTPTHHQEHEKWTHCSCSKTERLHIILNCTSQNLQFSAVYHTCFTYHGVVIHVSYSMHHIRYIHTSIPMQCSTAKIHDKMDIIRSGSKTKLGYVYMHELPEEETLHLSDAWIQTLDSSTHPWEPVL